MPMTTKNRKLVCVRGLDGEDAVVDLTGAIHWPKGSRGNDVELKRTKKGTWILNFGIVDDDEIGEWRVISDRDAVLWLLKNGFGVPNDVEVETL